MTIRKLTSSVFCLAATVALATPAFAWTLNDSEQPGSVLVFPKFIRGTGNDLGVSGQAVHANTELEVSVVCPPGSSCTANTSVRLLAHWVCPGCAETSFNLQTTVGGTLYFNPEGTSVFPNNARTTIPLPPCPRGYLIVWAVDGYDNAIKFDGLIGDAIIRAPFPGFGPTTARAYNALPIQASESLSTGDLTDVNGNGALDFDGNEYKTITGTVFGTVRYENAVPPEGVVQTDITLLTLDAVSNLRNAPTTVGLNFYTPDERLVDAATSFVCWTEQRLTDISPSLTTQTMGRKGGVQSTYAVQQLDLLTTVPVTLIGIVETQEGYVGAGLPGRSYSYWLYHDSNAVPTAFKP
jgi:hypothetical protein